ncbi:MAG: tetratricopeptide repeat-containing sulfotransferase family protein [Planctomycetota bacterium]|jgi:tetratricopeptide (TPR) repeat protein
MAKVRTPTARQALAMLDSGRFREAERVCRQILKSQRRNFDALHVLGVTLGKQNRFEEAVSCLERALKVQPGAAVIYCALGKLHAMQALYDEASAAYDKALEAQPGYLLALAGKAETFTRRGDYEAARRLLEPGVLAGAADAEVTYIYAETLQDAGEHEQAVARIEQSLADRHTGPIPRRKLLYALGTSYTKLKDHDGIMAHFTPEKIAQRPTSSNDSELPVLIIGMPRSGSTLTEQIIAAHPRAYGAGEITDLTDLIRNLPQEMRRRTYYPMLTDLMTAERLDDLARRHVENLRQYDREAIRIVDKHLENFIFLGLIAMMFPKARVIHCQRDPMAICFSIYTLALSPIQHPYSTDLRNLGLYYREYERLMDHWREVLDLPMLEIQYEDLVADQEAKSREIIDFCGLEWDDACLRFHETGRDVATASFDQVRKPMYTTAMKRYAPFEPHLGRLREALGLDGGS